MRLLRKTLIVASLLAAPAAIAPSALAQDDGTAAAALFAAVAADKDRAAALVPAWFGPVAAERVGIYAGFIIRLLREPAFADYVVAMEGPPGADTDAYLQRAAYAAGQTGVDAGMARLPVAEEATYLATGTGFAAWVADNHPDACRRIMTSNDPDDTATLALQAEHQNTLPPEAIYAYLDLGYRALLAEINDTPAAEAFTDAQLERGAEAYAEALEAAVLALPNAEGLVAAARLEDGATDADTCQVMLLTLTILDELTPPERDWAIHVIITQQPQ